MHICVLGLNHNTAPIAIREKLFISESTIPLLIDELKGFDFNEGVILSTCNRTEIYFTARVVEESLHKIKGAFFKHFGNDMDLLRDYTYLFVDEDAYRHLFLVASGLDSMVIGEPQILGQVKDAYRLAASHDATGFYLDKVFHKTFNVAKRIRTETRVGYNPVSISSMAVELSKKIFGELNRKKILVIGAGEMCAIALKNFKKEGLEEIFITNRTFQNAKQLAEEITGRPFPFQDIPELLGQVDMVLSSTGSDRPLIEKKLVVPIMKRRKNRPLFFIDIGVPRDIEPAVNKIENVYLYDIDDLKDLSLMRLSDRIKESEKANTIIEEEAEKFKDWLGQLDKSPLITHIVDSVEEMRKREFGKALSKTRDVDEETIRRFDGATRNIVKKLIHRHIVLIKENGDPDVLAMMKQLFNFEEDNDKDLGHRDEGE